MTGIKESTCMYVVRINVQVGVEPLPVDQMRQVLKVQKDKCIEESGSSLASLARSSANFNGRCAAIDFYMVGSMFMPASQHMCNHRVRQDFMKASKQFFPAKHYQRPC